MEVGFQNYCTFYNTFRRIMGASPENYAKTQERHNHSGELKTLGTEALERQQVGT